MAVKIETLISDAKAYYLADEANADKAFPYSPADATNAIAKKRSYPKSRLIGIVAEVYYAENGVRAPFPASAARGRKSAAAAVAKRRNAGGRLGRWEVLAYSLAATLGRPVSVAAVRALAEESGKVGVGTTSYTGRGTRAGAPATRTDEISELALADE